MRDNQGRFIKGHKGIGGFGKGSRHTPEAKEKVRQSLLGKVGEQARNWQGGKTDIQIIVRYSTRMKAWRDKVFERDNYICQRCGAKCGNGKTIKLHAHHIKSFAQYPELRFDIDNGLTLCHPCHRKTIKGKRRITCEI
ncbi:hypothetical protein LCGC14_1770690 [marine sediment metagenome]|uniref:HNH nuclease domain-containing protein n=1 Tax=marine sediment metagenome TaxID=412755 RepID=A0A0F9GYF6_9ZZZZ